MQDIKELVLFYNASPPRLTNKVKSPLDKKGKLGALFEGLANGTIQTDEDACWHLYRSKRETSTYRKLKSSLKELLLEGLYQLDVSLLDFTDYQQAYYECHKQWALVRILIGQNAHINAISLATKLLKRTIKYDFVQLSMDISSYLRIQFALRESNDKKYQEASRQFAYYREVYDAECLAEELFSLLTAKYVNTRAPKDHFDKIIQVQYEGLVPLLEKFDSYRLHLNGRVIGLMRHTSEHNYTSALVTCENAIRFFHAKPYEARGALQIFYYEKLLCHIQLRQYEAGRQTMKEGSRFLKEGTYNWFKWRELSVKISMYSLDYQEVGSVILHTVQQPRYQFLPENVKEIWRVYEAYFYFASLLHPVKMPPGYTFKTGRFFNETPIFSKDKSGMNIAIKIIRILILIAERKYALLFEETEALGQYCHRYLKDTNMHRSFQFMKMLLQVPAGQFDREAVEKRAQKYVQKLGEIPSYISNPENEIEIIAFEQLWSMTLLLLAR
jgi:hypothetical protein